MKTIMISVKPIYAEQIMNGKKTIEVRKFYIEPPFKVVNYVTKEKPYIKDFATYNAEHCKGKNYNRFISFNEQYNNNYTINGKVAFEYIVNKVDEYAYDYDFDCDNCSEMMYYIHSGELEKTCLTYDKLLEYGKGKPLYGWYISDLKIYDKPKEVNQFYKEFEIDFDGFIKCGENICPHIKENWRPKCTTAECPSLREKYKITRPPQNFVYCEVQNDT